MENFRSHSCLILILCAGCVGNFENPSAYSHQQYLCDPAQASQFQQEVATCYAAWLKNQFPGPGVPPPGCFGVVSMRGTLQGKSVVVTDPHISDTSLLRAQITGGSLFLDSVQFSGVTPYFLFNATFSSLGGASNESEPRTLNWSVHAAEQSVATRFSDSQAYGQLEIENGKESAIFSALDNSGNITLTTQQAKRLAGTFNADFGKAGDHLTGCFELFPQEIFREFF